MIAETYHTFPLPFNEAVIEMMFSNNQMPPAELLGTILNCCVKTTGESRYISRFLNLEPKTSGIVGSQFGMLGRFPEPIARKIMEVLNKKPIRLCSINNRIPKRRTGSEYVDYAKLKAFEFRSSYIIGTDFNAVLLDCNS